MKKLFHPITQQAALADLAELPHRIKANTYSTRRGPEGRNLRDQARRQLRWLKVFRSMKGRASA
ncbi:hypothetical protein [Aeromonas hydrophila]|uniref:hypothetical protein n=1 Tax=Aeromonas TaxID=642 RepID=UPI000332B864|nr:hypothetical protein [Aeromonas hydrophila]AGM45664.1 hypothetical protein AHML_19495 [Aeromonas hydrophila ML09-119]AHX34280.1 hypothetical protein V428_20295 [Aeromonas hydrophila subsp. hydrophila AL09-71]AHX71081.1 hypothetical protein V429_20325 [Aeromonas hydrophila pc104A]AXV28565.1 hypothetical protein BFW97_03165 [Aeromonas hydrophila]KYQ08401.1 hypothetical protein AW872_14990 [Aeromonas hydrophila]